MGAGAVASCSASPCSARGWSGRWPRSPACRWSRLRGLTGRLARENTQRKPGRTAATAAALMIGLALVTFVTVFAAGHQELDRLRGRRQLPGPAGDPEHRRLLADPARSGGRRRAGSPGSSWSRRCATAQAKVVGGGDKPRVSGSLPPDADEVLTLDWTEGGPATPCGLDATRGDPRQVLRRRPGTRRRRQLRFLTQTGKRPKLRSSANSSDRADLFGSAVVTQRVMASELRPDRRHDRLRQARPGGRPRRPSRRG